MYKMEQDKEQTTPPRFQERGHFIRHTGSLPRKTGHVDMITKPFYFHV